MRKSPQCFAWLGSAYDRYLNKLFASPRWGEHRGRYWLDAARFADTHGFHLDSGRDMTPWRDWVINAFNKNMPYDQFLTEQLAGDLLKSPRINAADKLNESALGTGHFRMVEHGYQPVDTIDEQVRNVDNQIDVAPVDAKIQR